MDELKTWYVVPLDDGWLVKERTAPEGEVIRSKSAAIARAEELCLDNVPARFLVRRSDGTIETEVRPEPRQRIEPIGEIELARSSQPHR